MFNHQNIFKLQISSKTLPSSSFHMQSALLMMTFTGSFGHILINTNHLYGHCFV